MKKIFILATLLMLGLMAGRALAQNAGFNGFCQQGGVSAQVSGLPSTNKMNGVIPSCWVTVYYTGTLTKAPIFKTIGGTVLTNPFQAAPLGSAAPGQWLFYAAQNQGYDVVMQGGILGPTCTTAPQCFTQPVPLTDLLVGGGGSGGTPTVIQVNGVPTTPVTPVNFVDSATVTWNLAGNVIRATAAGGGSGITGLTGDCLAGDHTSACLVRMVHAINGTQTLTIDSAPGTLQEYAQNSSTLVGWKHYEDPTLGTDPSGISGGPTAVWEMDNLSTNPLVTEHSRILQNFGMNFIDDNSDAGTQSGGTFVFADTPFLPGHVNNPHAIFMQTPITGNSGDDNSQIFAYGPSPANGGTQEGVILEFPRETEIAALFNPAGWFVNSWPLSGGDVPCTGGAISLAAGKTLAKFPACTLNTITPPFQADNYFLNATAIVYIVADGAFTTTNAGNIHSSPFTATPGQIYVGFYHGGTGDFGGTGGVWDIYPLGGGGGGGGVTWPAVGDVVVSTGTSSPAGLAPINGDCIVGSGGAWVVGSCTGGGTGTPVSVNGGSALAAANLNGTTPAAGTNGINVTWQVSGTSVSAELVGDGTSTHFLTGVGTWANAPVTSVSNVDSTLVISPTTGAVVASLNVAHANTWSAAQAFSAGINLSGSTSPLLLAGSAGTAGQCPISAGAGATPTWGTCGGGGGSGTVTDGAGTTTAGLISESTTTLHGIDYNSLLDNGHTTANTLTYSGAGGFSLTGGTGHQITIAEEPAPANPAAGVEKIYADSTTHLLSCLTSTGSSCMPSGGGGGTALLVASAEVVAFSAAPTFSTAFNVSRIVLTGNITSFTLGAGSDGQLKTLCFKQGSGPYTVTPPAGVHGFFAIGTTSGDWNCQAFAYDNTDSIWLATSLGVVNQ